MTFEQFNKFQKELLDDVVKMRDTKGKEYANGDDRFDNFKRLSAELGLTPEQIAWVYVSKHFDSIKQAIRTKEYTGRAEPIRGRFVDAICYLTLIAGMIEDTLKTQPPTLICNYCGFGTSDKATLTKHYSKEHNRYFPPPVEEYPKGIDELETRMLFKCKHCDFTTQLKETITDHYKFNHNALWIP